MPGERPASRRVWSVVAAATALATITGLVVWAAFRHGCDSEQQLSVAAAPEIAPAVQQSVDEWTRRGPDVDGRCLNVAVTAADPAWVAAAMTRSVDGRLDLAGTASGRAGIPHVWIPDSSAWLARVGSVDRALLQLDAPSIALSPVVLALPEPAARAEGWPVEEIGGRYALGAADGRTPLLMVEPRRSAVGLSGLLVTSRLVASGRGRDDEDVRAAVRAAYRGLWQSRAPTVEDLLGRLPDGQNGRQAAQPRAALLSEREVRVYDAARPAVPLAAVYPSPVAPPLDYPYAALAALPADTAEAAGQLRRWLRSERSRAIVTRHGFRTPDGAVGPGFPTGYGVSPEPVPAPRRVATESVRYVLDLWAEAAAAGPG